MIFKYMPFASKPYLWKGIYNIKSAMENDDRWIIAEVQDNQNASVALFKKWQAVAGLSCDSGNNGTVRSDENDSVGIQ